MASKAKIYLYKEGNECESLTGGWNIYNVGNLSLAPITKNFDNIYIGASENGAIGNLVATNTFDFEKFDSIHVEYKLTSGLTWIGIPPTYNDSVFGNNAMSLPLSDENKVVIRSITSSDYANPYIGFHIKGGFYMYSLFLETSDNVITINSITNDVITFNTSTLNDLISITKVEVLVNGKVSETYLNNFDNLTYTIDKNRCNIGDNKIIIKVTYYQGDDITEAVEEVINYKYIPTELSLKSPLSDVINRVNLITSSRQIERSALANILESKNVNVLKEDKMSTLIDKVVEIKQTRDIIASDNFICGCLENTGQHETKSSTNCLVSEFYIEFNGSVRITGYNYSSTGMGKYSKLTYELIREGVIIDSEVFLASSSKVLCSRDFNVKSGDKIKIYLCTTSSNYTAYSHSIALRGDIS